MSVDQSRPRRPPAWRVALQILWVGVALAFVASLIAAAVAPPPMYQRTWTLILRLWRSAFPLAVLAAPVAVAAWLAIFRGAARRLVSEIKRSWLATAAVGLLLAPWLAKRQLLPEPWGSTSLIGKVLLVIAMLAVGLLLARLLLAWQHRALTADGAPLIGVAWPLVVVMLGGLFLYQSTRKPAPHVFVFVIDVLGAGHLGSYGYERPTSPHIDRFAKDAVLFEQPVSASTFTKTSVASLFTGLYPHHHGVYVGSLRDTTDNVTSDVLRPDLTVMAEEMQRAGFLTIGLVHNGQLRPYMGFDQGFDLYDNEPGSMPRMLKRFRNERVRWARSQRLFAYLHFLDLHAPYRPAAPYDTMFGRYSDTFDPILNHGLWSKYVGGVKLGTIRPPPADMEQLRSLHDGQLVHVDKLFGRLLDDLKRDGLYDESLIVLTADHGEAFLQHGFVDHSNMPYQELVRVPLLVKLPASRNGGARVKTPVSMIDLLPTLLDFSGATSAVRRDGTSFLGMLENPAAAPAPRGIHVTEFESSAALREGNWKLLYHPSRKRELYDLERDPKELTNRDGEAPEVVQRLERRLAEVLEARKKVSNHERVIVDPKTVRELEALGYLTR